MTAFFNGWTGLLAGCLLGLAACTTSSTTSTTMSTPSSSSQLEQAYQGDVSCNGVAVSNDGRRFLLYPRPEGEAGPRIAELVDGKPVPYPSADWNDWQPGKPVAEKFVRVNSLRIGPDGLLWIVDTGTAKMGGKVLPGATKLVGIDLTTNQVARTIPLDAVLKPASFVDDVRFYGSTIFLTDAGEPALLLLDNATGRGRRVLENDPSTTDRRPMRAEGVEMTTPEGKPVLVHADQMEVSPDGKYFYFQACSGPLYRVEVRDLLDEALPAAELSKRVHLFYDTPTTGGTAIDTDGNIYVSDPDQKRILRLTPDAQATVLLQDERLLWPDAMWLDNHGNLWIPCAQLNRFPSLHGGVNAFQPPVFIYTLPLGVKPFRS